MPAKSSQKGSLTVKAYAGDAKTLLAFNLAGAAARKALAGFTVQIEPPGVAPYYLQNDLRFAHPEQHAQDPSQSAYATINAPIHKFRWVHVPGSVHQGLKPAFGLYTYRVTPRYFDANGSLQPLDPKLTASVRINVRPFRKGKLRLGFTRGFVQSQAFVHHFGLKALIKPKQAPLLFDTKAQSGTNASGPAYTFEEQYEWLGFTARERIFETLDQVLANPAWRIDLFAYDLDEPDFIQRMLDLGTQQRARVILDNAALHHAKPPAKPTSEDQFETLFTTAAGAGRIKRGSFGRYAHDKVLIVSDAKGPLRVLTGSTNFSVTGLYVNSNHVLTFDDRNVATLYAQVFEDSWAQNLDDKLFAADPLAAKPFAFGGAGLPDMSISFSPHTKPVATQLLGDLVARVNAEEQAPAGHGSVLFAVMQLDGGKDNPVYDALNALHARQSLFSFGISDNPDGIAFYPVGEATGVLVTGKPVKTQLPPPFSQVPSLGLEHQVHHKFVVCGFNGPNPVVYCGSSNLALAGEQVNGDNLLAIRDGDVATAFAIEALALVDHFNFLDRLSQPAGATAKATTGASAAPTAPAARTTSPPPAVPALKQQAAANAGWFLTTSDGWVAKFFDPNDLHCRDRILFAG